MKKSLTNDDYNELEILLREEQSVFHYSTEPDFVRECYTSCPLVKDETLDTGAGCVYIDDVVKTEDDVKVSFAYYDANYNEKKACISLGQAISFQLMRDDHNPYNYVLSECNLIITSKAHAQEMVNSPDNNRILRHRTRKLSNKKDNNK